MVATDLHSLLDRLKLGVGQSGRPLRFSNAQWFGFQRAYSSRPLEYSDLPVLQAVAAHCARDLEFVRAHPSLYAQGRVAIVARRAEFAHQTFSRLRIGSRSAGALDTVSTMVSALCLRNRAAEPTLLAQSPAVARAFLTELAAVQRICAEHAPQPRPILRGLERRQAHFQEIAAKSAEPLLMSDAAMRTEVRYQLALLRGRSPLVAPVPPLEQQLEFLENFSSARRAHDAENVAPILLRIERAQLRFRTTLERIQLRRSRAIVEQFRLAHQRELALVTALADEQFHALAKTGQPNAEILAPVLVVMRAADALAQIDSFAHVWMAAPNALIAEAAATTRAAAWRLLWAREMLRWQRSRGG